MDERLDDHSPEHDWHAEASAVIQDIQDLVNFVGESSLLESNSSHIYLNLTTLEDKKFTIELSALGFQIVSFQTHDSISTSNLTDERYYDTPYALLSKISPSFQEKLSTCLAEKLKALENDNVEV